VWNTTAGNLAREDLRGDPPGSPTERFSRMLYEWVMVASRAFVILWSKFTTRQPIGRVRPEKLTQMIKFTPPIRTGLKLAMLPVGGHTQSPHTIHQDFRTQGLYNCKV